jgi:hypothetical protein
LSQEAAMRQAAASDEQLAGRRLMMMPASSYQPKQVRTEQSIRLM